MKKMAVQLIIAIIFISFVSSTIIIDQQPAGVYSLGDFFSIPITITTTSEISGIFEMNLLCNGQEINFYRNGVGLKAGEEKKMEPTIALTEQVIGKLSGACVIKGIFKDEYVLTNEFKISNWVSIGVTSTQTEFAPGESFLVEGTATKENGKPVNGLIEVLFISEDSPDPRQLATITNGVFSVNFALPENMKAGKYLVGLTGYEQDTDAQTTNSGIYEYEIAIKQIPTNLEIIFESQEIDPGTPINVKAILHDQTGEAIESTALVTVKNNKGKIIEKKEIATGEFLELSTPYNEPSGYWGISITSNEITSDSTVKIKEKKDIKIEITDRNLVLTNIGNVPYEDVVLVKIGDEPLNIDVILKVGESKTYTLAAPDGEYDVEITTENGQGYVGKAVLTGKAIDIGSAGGFGTMIRYPFVWVFIIFILGFMVMTIFRKGYKRSFIGRVIPKRKYTDLSSKSSSSELPLRKKSIIKTKDRAELSLSIKGNKQSASVVCVKIKNLEELEAKKSNAEEAIQQAIDAAESYKASVYETQGNLFFILAPIKTKTFKNEKTALDIAQKTKAILDSHNKLAKDKIEFGISINNGSIIAKQEANILQFMSLGTLITAAKKIASLANKEILLGEEIKEKLASSVKTEKFVREKTPVFGIKEIRQHSEDNEKFIRNFLSSMDKK